MIWLSVNSPCSYLRFDRLSTLPAIFFMIWHSVNSPSSYFMIWQSVNSPCSYFMIRQRNNSPSQYFMIWQSVSSSCLSKYLPKERSLMVFHLYSQNPPWMAIGHRQAIQGGYHKRGTENWDQKSISWGGRATTNLRKWLMIKIWGSSRQYPCQGRDPKCYFDFIPNSKAAILILLSRAWT